MSTYAKKMALSLLVLVLLFACIPTNVFAETGTFSYDYYEIVPSGQSFYSFSGTPYAPFNTINHNWNGFSVKWVTQGSQKELAYCLQAEVEASQGSPRESQIDYGSLTEAQKQLINRVALYGCQGTSGIYGGTYLESYWATQILIWNIIYGYYDSTNEAAVTAIFFTNLPGAQSVYNQLKAAVKAAEQIPSFAAKTLAAASTYSLTWDPYEQVYKVELTDTNNVLSDFTVTCSNASINCSVSGNKLTLRSTAYVEAFDVTLTRNFTGASVYWIGGAQEQDMFTIDASQPAQSLYGYLKGHPCFGEVEIQKVVDDGETSLAGFQFQITGNGITPITLTTGADGKTPKQIIPPGTYTVTELTYPDRYKTPGTISISIAPGESNTFVFNNYIKKGYLAITKYKEMLGSDSIVPAENVTFEVYKKNAADGWDWVVDLVTDAHGKVMSDALPYGDYKIVEVAPEGYEPIPDQFVKIDVDQKVYYLAGSEDAVFNNRLYRGWLKIVKIDAESGKTIPRAGAKFKIYDANNHLIEQTIAYPTPHTISEFETDGSGILVLPETLPYGEYKLVETQAPEGYILAPDPVTFKIEKSKETPYMSLQVIEVKFADKVAKGKIKIEKTGDQLTKVNTSTTGFGTLYAPVFESVKLPGVKFNVIADEDIKTPEGTLKYAKDTVVDTIITGSDGTATSKELYLGNYRLEEVETAEGFVLSSAPIYVSIEYKDQLTAVVIKTVTISNARQKVDVNFKKDMELLTGKTTKPFADVVFGVFANQDIKNVSGDIVIPKDGLIELCTLDADGKGKGNTELPISKYYIQELKTAAGYILDTAKYEFEFKYGAPTVPTIVINLNGGEPILNKTISGKGYVLKVDTSNKFLPGAVFKLYTEDGVFVAELTTGADGKTNKVDITYGKYYWVETKAPAGCKLDTSKHYFDVVTNGQVIEIKVVNHYDVVKTGDSTTAMPWVIAAFLSLICLGGASILPSKKRRQDV